ncbi:MAG: hypothetical protein HFE51_00795 [Clostridia bacterium]|nr:hypothetical protein [Clostridia bacterium]
MKKRKIISIVVSLALAFGSMASLVVTADDAEPVQPVTTDEPATTEEPIKEPTILPNDWHFVDIAHNGDNGTVNPQGTRGAPELIKGSNNYVSSSDPGFVDYANGNYELKADSEVFKKIPGFQNVDMSKMGNNAPVGPVK